MFNPEDSKGKPITKEYAELRSHFERTIEMMQIKGNSEVHRKFWPADEFADFENAEKALSISCAKTNAVISEYTAAPIYMGDEGKGSHEWLIEFEKAPTDLDYFTSLLDNALCSINSDYEAKRYKSITLVMPTVRNLPQGTFYNWLSVKGKLGGQNKVPRLSNNRKIVDEVLGMVHEDK